MLLGGVLLLSLVLVLLGVVYQLLGSARDARRYPPLGQLVDVGGYRLHFHSSGEGRPTVILGSGLPGTCLSWTYVQPELARFTCACSYDRAGLGWSDASPHPRTSKQMVEELRRLLANAGIKPPYVLVGHSFGTFTVRLFAALYPNEVVGLVLVDPLHTREWLEMAEQQRRNIYKTARLCRYGTLLARLGFARFIAFLVGVGALRTARFGVKLMTVGAVRSGERMFAPASKLPPEHRPIVRTFWTQPKTLAAMASQIESLFESAAQVAAHDSYGDLPLVILSASNPAPDRTAEHNEVAQLSSLGKHVVIPDSGHWIHLDQPRAVVKAIREVVEAARW